ncbi:enoyl-CoA hydratase/isomerase family protein [Profundibacter sp.]
MSNDAVLYDVKDAIATITLNRPKALNALNMDLVEGLVAAVDNAANDSAVRCVVICSSSEHFMAGGDLMMFKEWRDQGVSVAQNHLNGVFDGVHGSVEKLMTMDKPVIASVQGAAAGFGLSLMLACDLAIVADNAALSMAYIRIGTTPDGGGSHSLTRIVGIRKAMELAMLAENVGAQAAKELGLANWVVPLDDLQAETAKIAARLAKSPTRALGRTKRLINQAQDTPLADHLKAEQDSFCASVADNDFGEGINAFIERRKATFTGA